MERHWEGGANEVEVRQVCRDNHAGEETAHKEHTRSTGEQEVQSEDKTRGYSCKIKQDITNQKKQNYDTPMNQIHVQRCHNACAFITEATVLEQGSQYIQ